MMLKSRVASVLAVAAIVAMALAPSVRAPDTMPPSIGPVSTFPSPRIDRPAVGDDVLILVYVSDDVAVGSVSVNVIQPDGTPANVSMVPSPAPRYEHWNAWPQAGAYALTVWAVDTSGNAASAFDSFSMLPHDATPPVIAGAVAYPGTQQAGGPVTVSATITDDRLVVWAYVNYTLPDATVEDRMPFWVHGSVFYQTWFWNQVGTYAFTVWALDHGGNYAYASGVFRIVGASDATPPEIVGARAAPSAQTAGGAVTVFATITDDTVVADATVVVTRPDGTPVVAAMLATGDTYLSTDVWDDVGTYAFTITARDGAGNSASASGSFAIRAEDIAPPTITPTPPGGANVGDDILISVTITDDGPVQQVRLVYATVDGQEVNVTMARSGNVYSYWIPAQDASGTVRYRIYAADAAGNSRLSKEYAVTVGESSSTFALDAATFAAMLGASVVVVATILAAVFGAATLAVHRGKGRLERGLASPPESPPESEKE